MSSFSRRNGSLLWSKIIQRDLWTWVLIISNQMFSSHTWWRHWSCERMKVQPFLHLSYTDHSMLEGSSVFSIPWIEVLIQNLQQRISCVQNKPLTGDKLPPNLSTYFCILMQIVPRKSKIFIITALSKSPNISGIVFTKSLHQYKIVAYHQLWVLLFSYLFLCIHVYTWLYVHHHVKIPERPRRMLDPLELELQRF